MNDYLLLKLAEEAGELATAAIKHKLHGTKATRSHLEGEIGDVSAMVSLLSSQDGVDIDAIQKRHNNRFNRETKRAKRKYKR